MSRSTKDGILCLLSLMLWALLMILLGQLPPGDAAKCSRLGGEIHRDPGMVSRQSCISPSGRLLD